MLRSPDYETVLGGLNLDLYGGETLSLLYSTEAEAKTLCRLLSSSQRLHGRRTGSVRLNGIPVGPQGLWARVAYVDMDHWTPPPLTVKEHLRLTAALLPPASKAFRTASMIAQLIQTLALGPYQDRLIAELGRTERTRLRIAAKILLDTDIILLDDVTRGMDVYDAAFILDYLRDWAAKLNRIVLLSANSPTLQLLAMFRKAAVLASGHLLYVGPSRDLPSYFTALDYPCPLFKAPCDYYVDLVTQDNLTMEAGAESGERIRRLAELWAVRGAAGEAPPPGGLTTPLRPSPGPAVRRLNPLSAIPVLYWRFWLLMLNGMWGVAKEVVVALLVSLWLGTVYLQLTTAHPGGVRDRLGLLSCLLSLALLPLLAINIDTSHTRSLRALLR